MSRMSMFREFSIVAIACSASAFAQAGLGMTIAPLNIIGDGLGTSKPGELSWFAAAYSLTVGTFILIAGRLGDMYGHKNLFVGGFFCYSLWSLLAGVSNYAHSQTFFDVCRGGQGTGAAMLIPNSLAILGRMYAPGGRKDFVFAVYGATNPNGFIFGAVFASLLAEFLWWPWIFWISAIASATFGVLAFIVLPTSRAETTMGEVGEPKDIERFDWLGAFTGIGGLVLFNVAWNQAPIVGWDHASVITLLILGLVLLLAFGIVEGRVSKPLVPLSALSGSVGFVLGCLGLAWASFGIWVYYVYSFMENLRHISPLEATAQTAPVGISGCLAALTTGYLLSRVRPAYLMTIAMLNFCVGIILLATMPVSQTYWIQTFLSFVITVWGMDISFPAATIILSNFVRKEDQGIAASLVATIVNYSASIGLGIAGTVESKVNRGGQDILRGYRGAFYAGIGLSGMGVILATYFIWVDARQRRQSR